MIFYLTPAAPSHIWTELRNHEARLKWLLLCAALAHKKAAGSGGFCIAGKVETFVIVFLPLKGEGKSLFIGTLWPMHDALGEAGS